MMLIEARNTMVSGIKKTKTKTDMKIEKSIGKSFEPQFRGTIPKGASAAVNVQGRIQEFFKGGGVRVLEKAGP